MQPTAPSYSVVFAPRPPQRTPTVKSGFSELEAEAEYKRRLQLPTDAQTRRLVHVFTKDQRVDFSTEGNEENHEDQQRAAVRSAREGELLGTSLAPRHVTETLKIQGRIRVLVTGISTLRSAPGI